MQARNWISKLNNNASESVQATGHLIQIVEFVKHQLGDKEGVE